MAGIERCPPATFMRMRREIPQGLTDEGRLYKYLSKRSLIVCLVTIGFGILIGNLISSLGITVYFIVFWIVLTFGVTGMTMIKIPNRNWLGGGGEYIDMMLFKILARRRNRCLYIKGYNQMDYEEKDNEFMRSIKGEVKE